MCQACHRRPWDRPANIAEPAAPPAAARCPVGDRAGAEALLRELAFVYHLSRRVRHEILGGGDDPA